MMMGIKFMGKVPFKEVILLLGGGRGWEENEQSKAMWWTRST